MARNRGKNEWSKLTKRDLTSYDDYGTKAVLYAMDHGAVGKISNRGHAIIKAPDGQIMGVAPDTRKARQVIAIKLRDLFGNGGLQEVDAEAAADPTPEPAAAASQALAAISDEPTLDCPEPKCAAVFVTPGARYAHIHKHHHVCPHPGCSFTRDHRGHVMAHFRTAHAPAGEHPRAKGATRKAAERAATPKPRSRRSAATATVEAQQATHPAPEVSASERPREQASDPTPPLPWVHRPDELVAEIAATLQSINERLAHMVGLEGRVQELEQENDRLRQSLANVRAALQATETAPLKPLDNAP